jgi:hypothetical protein
MRPLRASAGVFLVALLSCGAPPAGSPKGTPGLDVPRSGRLDRGALADALAHPGAKPLVPQLPAQMREPLATALGSSRDDRARLEGGKLRVERLAELTSGIGADELVAQTKDRRGPFLVDLEALVLLEPLVVGDGPLHDEAAPFAFDAYAYAAALATTLAGATSGGAPFAELAPTARAFGDQLASTIVRRAGTDERTRHVLLALARQELRAGERDRPLTLLEEVARSSARDDADTWQWLTYAYARVLDAPRATVAAERARAAGPPSKPTSESLQRWVTDAATAVRLRASSDLDSRLALAAAYEDLDLSELAGEEYASLRHRFPKDARVRLGIARQRLGAFLPQGQSSLLESALAELEDDDLEHVTPEYRQVALGLTVAEVARLLGAQSREDALAMLAGLVDKLALRARAVEADDPARGAAYGYLAGVLRDVLRGDTLPFARLARTFDETRALRRRFPGSLEVAKIALAAASLTERRDEALADMSAPAPGAAATDPAYMLDRATTTVALAAYSLAGPAVARARPNVLEARGVPGADAGTLDALEGDTDTLDALGGRSDAWAQATAAYQRALPHLTGAARARALSNAGFVAYRQSRIDDARSLWEQAASEDVEGQRARCNLAIQLAGDASTRAQARAQLETWVNDPGSPCLALTYATLAAIGEADHEPRKRVRDLAQAALERLDQEGVFAGPPYAQQPKTVFRMSAALPPGPSAGSRVAIDVAVTSLLWFNPLPPRGAAALRKLAKR